MIGIYCGCRIRVRVDGLAEMGETNVRRVMQMRLDRLDSVMQVGLVEYMARLMISRMMHPFREVMEHLTGGNDFMTHLGDLRRHGRRCRRACLTVMTMGNEIRARLSCAVTHRLELLQLIDLHVQPMSDLRDLGVVLCEDRIRDAEKNSEKVADAVRYVMEYLNEPFDRGYRDSARIVLAGRSGVRMQKGIELGAGLLHLLKGRIYTSFHRGAAGFRRTRGIAGVGVEFSSRHSFLL